MTRRKRRTISGQQKVEIIKRHFVDQVPVSELCEAYRIQPTQFYQWQKQLFENGEKAFELAGNHQRKSSHEQKLEKLQAKLVQKNEVVAELLEEHVKLKKDLGEL